MRSPLKTLAGALACAVAAAALALAPARGLAQDGRPVASLKGKFLVADPAMPDARFARTVIFMLQHSDSGAVGIVVNRPAARRPLADVLRAFGLPESDAKAEIDLYWGGPVELNKAFVLHSDEFRRETTAAIVPGVALTAPKDLLSEVARGSGPARMLLALGYAGWSPGQLERELEQKAWAVIGAGADLLFDADHAGKWDRAWKMRVQDL